MKTTKTMKKMMRTPNTLIISQRLDVTDWKYLRISLCAASTFKWVSSTFESILKVNTRKMLNTMLKTSYVNVCTCSQRVKICRHSSKDITCTWPIAQTKTVSFITLKTKCLVTNLWTISSCSLTIVASCVKILPSSTIVCSMFCIVSARLWMYESYNTTGCFD